MAKAADANAVEVRADLATRIEELEGGGVSLPATARQWAEARLGFDFRNVRIHTGVRAASTARSLNARAFTLGRNIAFAPGEFAPSTRDGQRLLAHELTHVVQQGGGSGAFDRPVGAPGQGRVGAVQAARVPNSRGTPLVQRDGLGDLAGLAKDFGGAALSMDPKAFLATIWLKLGPDTKARYIDRGINAAQQGLNALQGDTTLGPAWVFFKEGLKGFFAKLASTAVDVKIKVVDKIAGIMAGRDEAFTWAYLKGLLKGFFVDGALGIFFAVWDLIKGLKGLWDFLKRIGDAIAGFPDEIRQLLQRLEGWGEELVANIGPAIDEFKRMVLDGKDGQSFVALLLAKGKALAQEAGAKVAGSLLEFFSKPEASAEIGETVGSLTGQVLWEVVFAALTAGGGAAITGIKEAVGVVGKLFARVTTGILKVVEEIKVVFTKVVGWVKGAIQFLKGKLAALSGRLAELFEQVGEFLSRLLGSCHESRLVCNFKAVIGKLAKINKGAPGAMKELAGKIHGLRPPKGQAIALVEVRVGSEIRYAAATNSGAGWAVAQTKALGELGIEKIPSVGRELIHAEANVDHWVQGLRNTGQKVEILRWGVSATAEGGFICSACRGIIARLGGTIEEFAAMGSRY